MGGIEPIAGRIGHVGGIESLTVDGRRWYFGFDFSSDTVVSPLIDDPAAMAAFASRYMVQRDGAHDDVYWRELVDSSVEESDLADEHADREYTSERLASERLTPGHHLRYVLGAATGWADSFFQEAGVQSALTTLGIDESDRDWDCVDTCIDALRWRDASQAEAARFVMARYIEFLLDAAPANWPGAFAALRIP